MYPYCKQFAFVMRRALVASNFTFHAARLRLRLLRSVAAPLPKKMLRLFSGSHRVRRLRKYPSAFADFLYGKTCRGDARGERLVGERRLHKNNSLFEVCLRARHAVQKAELALRTLGASFAAHSFHFDHAFHGTIIPCRPINCNPYSRTIPRAHKKKAERTRKP